MKKFAALLTALALVLSLAACGPKTPPPANSGSNVSPVNGSTSQVDTQPS